MGGGGGEQKEKRREGERESGYGEDKNREKVNKKGNNREISDAVLIFIY